MKKTKTFEKYFMKKENSFTKQLSNKFGIASLILTILFLQASIINGQTLTFEEYEPISTLIVPETAVTRAKFPFIDVHSHLWRVRTQEDVEKMVGEMNQMNLQVVVNLSGGSGERLANNVKTLKTKYSKRFMVFANIDFRKIDEPNFGENAAKQLEQDVKNGASGLKIFKNLGLTVKDASGKRVPTDDPRLDPIFKKCAELGIPVLIHTGEPSSFFEPHNRFNERWLELKMFPRRARPADKFPSWEKVMSEQHNLFAKHPKTIFINAHFGWMANDLKRLGKLIDKYPNVYPEVAAIVAELGRQPKFAREFFIKYQDRVLFGKDTYRPVEYHTYFRIFETDDEYFPYFRRRHAFWRMYGLDLPDEVLKKFYYKNAFKIIPGIDKSQFPK